MYRLITHWLSGMNIDRVIFQTSSEQLHFSHNSVYLYVTHPVTEHADKLYVDLKLTLKCILKGKFQNCAQFRHDLRFWNSLCDLCKVFNSVWSVSVGVCVCVTALCAALMVGWCVSFCVCVCVCTVCRWYIYINCIQNTYRMFWY